MEIKSEDEKVRVFKTLARISKKKDGGKAAHIERVEKRLSDLADCCAAIAEESTNMLTTETVKLKQTAYEHALKIIHEEVK